MQLAGSSTHTNGCKPEDQSGRFTQIVPGILCIKKFKRDWRRPLETAMYHFINLKRKTNLTNLNFKQKTKTKIWKNWQLEN